jgi:hypothetical protein
MAAGRGRGNGWPPIQSWMIARKTGCDMIDRFASKPVFRPFPSRRFEFRAAFISLCSTKRKRRILK